MKQYFNISHYAEFHVGSPAISPSTYALEEIASDAPPVMSSKYRLFKAGFDYGSAVLVLPVIAMVAGLLLVLNPIFNPGPLLFRQERVGRYGKSFHMWKFRSMIPAKTDARDPNAKLEEHRITKLGRFLRKMRIDELPNFFNVLRGEMSVIGPRPDAANHARLYSETVLGYGHRHRVKPGITGLAQVEHGYVEDAQATAKKAFYDNIYVSRQCGRLDLYIIGRTIAVMLGGFGK